MTPIILPSLVTWLYKIREKMSLFPRNIYLLTTYSKLLTKHILLCESEYSSFPFGIESMMLNIDGPTEPDQLSTKKKIILFAIMFSLINTQHAICRRINYS